MSILIRSEAHARFRTRPAELRKATGFTLADLAEKRQMLRPLDAFVERGQSERKVQVGAAR